MNTGGKPLGELFLGFALVLLGILILAGTLSITVAPAYSRVGPRAFPFAVAAGMIVLGFFTRLRAGRARRHRLRIMPSISGLSC